MKRMITIRKSQDRGHFEDPDYLLVGHSSTTYF